jgi:hypothetical protein
VVGVMDVEAGATDMATTVAVASLAGGDSLTGPRADSTEERAAFMVEEVSTVVADSMAEAVASTAAVDTVAAVDTGKSYLRNFILV